MARRSAEIIESLSEADRVLVAEKIAEADRKLERLRKQDSAIADSRDAEIDAAHERLPCGRRRGGVRGGDL